MFSNILKSICNLWIRFWMHFGNINLHVAQIYKSYNRWFQTQSYFQPFESQLCDILLDLFQHQKGVEWIKEWMRLAAIMCMKACITSLMIQIGKYRRGCLLIPYPYIRVVRLVNVFNNPDYLGIWIYCMHIWNELGYELAL